MTCFQDEKRKMERNRIITKRLISQVDLLFFFSLPLSEQGSFSLRSRTAPQEGQKRIGPERNSLHSGHREEEEVVFIMIIISKRRKGASLLYLKEENKERKEIIRKAIENN